MSCSASAFKSSGRSGDISSGWSSPSTRSVGGRPTFRCKSDALRRMSSWRTDLKLSWLAWGAAGAIGAWAVCVWLAIWVDPEEHLPVLDGLRVLNENLLDDARVLGLDLVHDLHRLDDAEDLPLRDARTHRNVRLGSRLGRRVERAHHG